MRNCLLPRTTGPRLCISGIFTNKLDIEHIQIRMWVDVTYSVITFKKSVLFNE